MKQGAFNRQPRPIPEKQRGLLIKHSNSREVFYPSLRTAGLVPLAAGPFCWGTFRDDMSFTNMVCRLSNKEILCDARSNALQIITGEL